MNSRMQWLSIACLAVLAGGLSAMPSGCAARPKISRLTVLVSGYTQAYIKNCGCSSGQKGGELRKARVIKEERKAALLSKPTDEGKSPEVLLVEIGNFTDPIDAVRKAESQGVVDSMKLLGYNSVGLGFNELRYQQQDLFELLNDPNLLLNTANLSFVPPTIGEDKSADLAKLVQPYVIKEYASGYRIGVIHLIDTNIADELPEGYGYKLAPCGPVAEQILKDHRREAELWVVTIADPLYGGADLAAIGALSDVLLAIGVTNPNPLQAERSTQVKFPYYVDKPYDKAKDLVRVQVYFNQDGSPPSIIGLRVAIPEQVQPDADVQKIIDNLQSWMEELQNREDEEMLKRPVRHPMYLGYETCRECHEEMVDLLAKSKHAQAYVNLAAKGRGEEKSAQCSRCHVTGHAAMGGKLWSGGWNVIDNQPEMRGVQCEVCHGPGEYHVKLMHRGGTKAPGFSADGRDEFGMQPATDKTCLQCHDPSNSPKFNYKEYWEKIVHKMPADQKERKGKE